MNVVGHDQKQSRPPDLSSRIFNCRRKKFGSQLFVRQIIRIFRCCSNPNVKDSALEDRPKSGLHGANVEETTPLTITQKLRSLSRKTNATTKGL